MSVMEDVILNAKTAVGSVGRKAGEVIDRSKLRIAAVDIKSELSGKYRMLGRLYYESETTGKKYDESIKKLIETITDLNEQLAAVKEAIAGSEKKIRCPECSEYNQKGAVFCSKCGSKLSSAKPPYEDDQTQEELLDFAEEIADEDIDI